MVDVSKSDVEKWIWTLGKKVATTGQPICPYSQKTLQDKKIQIVPARSTVFEQCVQYCDLFSVLNLDVIVVYFNHTISEKKLSNLARRIHSARSNFAVLYDHPDNAGLHQGVSFSFGKAPLMIIQELSKLKRAQAQLKKTDYYRAWGLDDPDMFY